MRPEVYARSDYAGMETNNAKFYYGYERIWCPKHGFQRDSEPAEGCGEDCDSDNLEWVFRAEIQTGEEPKVIEVPFSKLNAPGNNRFNCEAALSMGIAWVLTKYGIKVE